VRTVGDPELPAALGGPGWSPRSSSLREELGSVWAACGVDREWGLLREVLLHRPGAELAVHGDPGRALMLGTVDPRAAARQHEALERAYGDEGVAVHLVEPPEPPPPNLVFVADLFLMTPEGAILGRPASRVRAGEERLVARRLSAMGIPILRSVRGRGTFEGADALWLAPDHVLLAVGLRTNAGGASQVRSCLEELGVRVTMTRLPPGAMHLMGLLRILDADLAVAWPGRLEEGALEALRRAGFQVAMAPDLDELTRGQALNMVTLGPRRVLMAAGNPALRTRLEGLHVRVAEVEISELARAAGGIACMTGVLRRSEG